MADLNAQTRIPLGWAFWLGAVIVGFIGTTTLAHSATLAELDKRVALTEQAVVTLKDIHLELLRQRERE